MKTTEEQKDVGRAVQAGTITEAQMELIKRTVAKDATDDELKLYLHDCARRHVHPLDKLIHFTKRGGKYTPVTSIDFMRSRASASGQCAGIDDAIFDGGAGYTPEGVPTMATVTVYRLIGGMRCAFTATARWKEYYPGEGKYTGLWDKMPHTMLSKCAEALALRKAFPHELSGLYENTELDQAIDEIPSKKAEKEAYPGLQAEITLALAELAELENRETLDVLLEYSAQENLKTKKIVQAQTISQLMKSKKWAEVTLDKMLGSIARHKGEAGDE